MNLAIITRQNTQGVSFALTPESVETRQVVLANALLIGKVRNEKENTDTAKAVSRLRAFASSVESARKKLKDPLLEQCRLLDNAAKEAVLEVEKEVGRLQNLMSEFALEERRRVAEEQEMQRRRLAEIEAERQRELQRIAEEQEAERRRLAEIEAQRIREERRVAEEQKRKELEIAKAKADAEAKLQAAANEDQRKAAEEAKAKADAEAKLQAEESEHLRKLAEEAKAKADAEAAKIEQRTNDGIETLESQATRAVQIESAPITAARATGQRVTYEWEFVVVDPRALAANHPEAVKIEPIKSVVKSLLNQGLNLPGVNAKRVIKSTVAPSRTKTIDI